ncbi:MAG: helix-turn-helix domain-containing protein [Lachnospiraceae bacterium]|nr:helix-turn-helix domain-containing protein [Lachnospiraceae bacterium]
MYHVIIVDDDKWAIEDIKESFCFADWNFEITGEYGSAEEALPHILAEQPELVVTDIQMNRHSGLEMIRTCREQGMETLFILVSGYDDFNYVQDAFKYGVFFYLLKPIDDAKVHEVMEQLWEKLDKTSRLLSELHSPGTFEKAIAYIEKHYMEAITLESVAKALFINKNYLSQLISKRKGETFIQYRNRLRVDYAKRLIRMGNHNMTDVAASAGFEDASQFSRIFRQIAGESPTGYRARYQARK